MLILHGEQGELDKKEGLKTRGMLMLMNVEVMAVKCVDAVIPPELRRAGNHVTLGLAVHTAARETVCCTYIILY